MNTPELTDDEVDNAIQAAYDKRAIGGHRPLMVGRDLWRLIYRAGLAMGRARAIEECAQRVERNPVDQTHYEMAQAIRALAQPVSNPYKFNGPAAL